MEAIRPVNSSAKFVFNRFQFNLVPALFVLVIAYTLELLMYRLLGNLGFYIGVGTEGVRATMADFSIFLMLFSGALSSILLFWAVARIVNHPNMPGIWWRAILIFISPLYLLSIFWSIWTPLSNWILMASLVAAAATVVLVCIISLIRYVPFGLRRLFGVIAIIFLVSTIKWIALDFFHVEPGNRWGVFLLNAYEVAQFFMVLLPFFAFFLFTGGPGRSWLDVLIRKPSLPALIISLLATMTAMFVMVIIQRITGEGNWMDAGQFVARVAYRTIGLKLGWPFAALMTGLSLFFLGMTSLTLIFRHRAPLARARSTGGNREIGFGLLLLYLSGIQPYTVYQLSASLLGVLLIVMGVADAYPGYETPPPLKELQEELES
jgi:hypothetical protein